MALYKTPGLRLLDALDDLRANRCPSTLSKYAQAQRECSLMDEYRDEIRRRKEIFGVDLSSSNGSLYFEPIDGERERWQYTRLAEIELCAQREFIRQKDTKKSGNSVNFVEK